MLGFADRQVFGPKFRQRKVLRSGNAKTSDNPERGPNFTTYDTGFATIPFGHLRSLLRAKATTM
jgi:hypothetical protein